MGAKRHHQGCLHALAESGFVAFAPDLYHGKVADTIADAETLVKALDANHLQAKAEIAEATRFLSERVGQADGEPAVIGFSLGALLCAGPRRRRSRTRSVPSSSFMGPGVTTSATSRAAYLGHFAENDQYEPQADVDELEEALQRAGRPVTFYHYSGTGHWFFEPDRTNAYNKAAASLAWERTLAFLKNSLQPAK